MHDRRHMYMYAIYSIIQHTYITHILTPLMNRSLLAALDPKGQNGAEKAGPEVFDCKGMTIYR